MNNKQHSQYGLFATSLRGASKRTKNVASWGLLSPHFSVGVVSEHIHCEVNIGCEYLAVDLIDNCLLDLQMVCFLYVE